MNEFDGVPIERWKTGIIFVLAAALIVSLVWLFLVDVVRDEIAGRLEECEQERMIEGVRKHMVEKIFEKCNCEWPELEDNHDE